MPTEAHARTHIDTLLQQAGWGVCDLVHANLGAALGVAIREFPLKPGHGVADYLLYVRGKACGVIEAKRPGATLKGDQYRQPIKGDLLYTLVGSYGIAVRVKTTERFCVQRHMAIPRPHSESPMDYLTIAMANDKVFKQATEFSTGTALMTVPLSVLRSIAFGLTPKTEQTRIVAEVDRHLSIIREVKGEVDINLQRVDVAAYDLIKSHFKKESGGRF